MKGVMLDIETMGTHPSAPIVAIGAVYFDSEIKDTFYRTIKLSTNKGKIDGDTVVWWLQQSEEARKDIINAKTPLVDALLAFSEWLPKGVEVWGNGSNFDNVILRSAYQLHDMDCPFPFWKDRCYRTVCSLYPDNKRIQLGTYHNALDDAISQTKHLLELLK